MKIIAKIVDGSNEQPLFMVDTNSLPLLFQQKIHRSIGLVEFLIYTPTEISVLYQHQLTGANLFPCQIDGIIEMISN